MPIKIMCPICDSEETFTMQKVRVSEIRRRRRDFRPKDIMCAKCSFVGHIEEFTVVMPDKEVEKWVE